MLHPDTQTVCPIYSFVIINYVNSTSLGFVVGGLNTNTLVFSTLTLSFHCMQNVWTLSRDFWKFCKFRGDASPQALISAHGSRDPGKSAWAEHFLELGSLIITKLQNSQRWVLPLADTYLMV